VTGHSIVAVKSMQQLLSESGGRLLVIAGDPHEQARFPAGLGRAPSHTLLESVLSYLPANIPDHVWVLSAADERLPQEMRIGQPSRKLCELNSAWVFRGDGRKSAAAPLPPVASRPMSESIRPQSSIRTRPSSFDQRFMCELGGGWASTVEKVAELVEAACGVRRTQDICFQDTSRPKGRILLILDERLLWKITRQELTNIGNGALGAIDIRERLNRRLNDVPRLLKESVALGTPADLIVLAQAQTTARLFREGRMVNQQMAVEYHRSQPHGQQPDLAKVDERFLALRWPITVDNACTMPRWDKAHPLSSYFQGVNTDGNMYMNLVQATPNLPPAPLTELEQLIGLQRVKTEVRGVFNGLKLAADRERHNLPPLEDVRRHMVFAGNPGTGKTRVARIIGHLYARQGILSGDNFTEVTDKDLIGEVIGETPRKCEEVFERATGGVLFIDEAYQLRPRGDNDFAHIVVTAMVRWMTNRPRDLAFILAGYSREMRDFLNANAGLASRLTEIQFDDYTDDELMLIAQSKLDDTKERFDAGAEAAFRSRIASHRAECARDASSRFANGREVENLLNACRTAQASRLYGPGRSEPTAETLSTITTDDVGNATYPTVSVSGAL
jgi:hypothetical protein